MQLLEFGFDLGGGTVVFLVELAILPPGVAYVDELQIVVGDDDGLCAVGYADKGAVKHELLFVGMGLIVGIESAYAHLVA